MYYECNRIFPFVNSTLPWMKQRRRYYPWYVQPAEKAKWRYHINVVHVLVQHVYLAIALILVIIFPLSPPFIGILTK
jgi:hypothetical protein